MTTDLEQQLREFGESHRLSRPAADVMGRGDQLRRRRGKRVSLGATAAALVGVSALAGLGGIDNQARPSADSASDQGLDVRLMSLPQSEVDAANKECQLTLNDPRALAATGDRKVGEPIGAVTIGKRTFLTYHSGSRYHVCMLKDGTRAPAINSGPWDDRVTVEGARFQGLGYMTADMIAEDIDEESAEGDADGGGRRVPSMNGFGFVNPDVVSVEVRIGGRTIPARVGGGIFAVWAEGEFTNEDMENGTLVATNSDGEEIVTSFEW
ncbi:MAG: hypothetical protein ACRCYU_23320 [Nocardioides sp.]